MGEAGVWVRLVCGEYVCISTLRASGLVVRASGYYPGLGFEYQLVPEIFLWNHSLSHH